MPETVYEVQNTNTSIIFAHHINRIVYVFTILLTRGLERKVFCM